MFLPDSIKHYLRENNPEIEEAEWGCIVRKPPYRPSRGVRTISILGHPLSFGDGELLDERVIVIGRTIPQREHPEVREEVVKNIGETPIVYYENDSRETIAPGQVRAIIYTSGPKRWGERHGYDVEESSGLLYVARTLLPECLRED